MGRKKKQTGGVGGPGLGKTPAVPAPSSTFKGGIGEVEGRVGADGAVRLPAGRVGRLVPTADPWVWAVKVVDPRLSGEQQAVLDRLAELWERVGARRPSSVGWLDGTGGQGAGPGDVLLRSRPWAHWRALMGALPPRVRLAVLAYVVDGEVRGELVGALGAIRVGLDRGV